ncbi:MAG: prepilin-type N-terminal cleavage/methylation domain-containing protein [Acidobacteria bacterium]|nr:prepilin-type N-terminal cleavage/methylation domain-containing protein [Acidobacteriota bacterium]
MKSLRAKASRQTHLKKAAMRGFTLLEVLVATAVLGTSIAAMFSLLAVSIGNTRKIEYSDRALMLGEAKLNEFLVGRGQGTGNLDTDELRLNETVEGRWDEKTRWKVRATRVEDGVSGPSRMAIPVRIDFDIYWRREDGWNEGKLSLETMQIWRDAPASGGK